MGSGDKYWVFKTVPSGRKYNMRALNAYTHYNLRILNIWKGLGRQQLHPFDQNVARSKTPVDCPTRRKFAPAAQLHRPPRQGARHHACAVDRVVSPAGARGVVASRSRRRARTAADLAGAAARSAGRTWIAG